MCMYSLQKPEKICSSLPKCSFFLRRRRVSVIYFCVSNSFKMGDNLPSSVRSSQSSSDSLSSNSDSLKSSSDSPVEQIMKIDKSKVDEIKMKVEQYPKLEEEENEELYQGLEHGIVFSCCEALYAKFSSMTSAFGEFAV